MASVNFILVAFAYICILSSDVIAKQCVSLQGVVRCGQGPTVGDKQVFLRMEDKDKANTNDLMDEGYASRSGIFYLSGCATDVIGSIDPILKIYHKCKGQPKVATVVIPDAAIDKEYRFTEIVNLDRTFRNEVNEVWNTPVCPSGPRSRPGVDAGGAGSGGTELEGDINFKKFYFL